LSPQWVEHLLKTDVFDEAVSTGLLPYLKGRAGMVTGMDVSNRVAHAVRKRCPGVELAVADVRVLPFRDGSFDCIVSNSTLDHLASQQEIRHGISGLADKLKSGGTLILTMDNLSNPVVWIRNALPFNWLHRLRLVPYCIGATCGPGKLVAYVRQSGLRVREVRAILHCPRVLAVGAAGLLSRRVGPESQDRFLRFLMSFEVVARWPTRFVTGYFVAVLAEKPSS
jgi:SAM-dependent methyltransferase